jgi:hypothetical protein
MAARYDGVRIRSAELARWVKCGQVGLNAVSGARSCSELWGWDHSFRSYVQTTNSRKMADNAELHKALFEQGLAMRRKVIN